jgi:Flp pilus assembly protein TadD/O-antigen ligase
MLQGRLRSTVEGLGICLLGFALPLVVCTFAEDAYRLPQLILLSLSLCCLCATWSGLPKASPAWFLALAFFGVRILSALLAYGRAGAPMGQQLGWIAEQGLYATLYAWGIAHLGDASRASRLKAALLGGAAVAALYALLQNYGVDPLAQGRVELGFAGRAQSSLGNPDFWGGFVILVLPFSLEYPLLQALLMVALVLSQTRAAWLGFAASAAVLALGGWRRPLWRGLAFGFIALILFAFPNPLNQRGLRSVQRLASSLDVGQADAGGRFFMARAAWRIAAAHPLLGIGGGRFGWAFVQEQGRMMAEPGAATQPYRFTLDAHNDFLQIAAESGFPALLAFVALLVLSFGMAWRRGAWVLAAVLASFGADALLNFPLSVVPSAALAWLAMALCAAPPDGAATAAVPAAAGAVSSVAPAAAVPPSAPMASAFSAAPAAPAAAWRLALCLLPLLSAWLFMRQLQASALLNRGMNLSLAGRPAEAEAPLLACAAITPDDERPWMRLGLNADGRGDDAAAESDFSHCLWLPEGLSNLSLVQAKQGNLEQAKASSLAALLLNPRSVEALGNLGKIQYLQGDARAAEASYLRGLALQPSWSQGHFNLAAIYINTGRPALARPELQQVLNLEPGNAQAAQLLRGLK